MLVMPEVRKIEAIRKLPELKNVAIYARVSTLHDSQEGSLDNQIEGLKDYLRYRPGWLLYGVYADERSGSNISGRENYKRLLADCELGKIRIVLTKSVSRLGRNTLDILQTIRKLHSLKVEVYCYLEELYITDPENEFLITLISAFAQEQNAGHSENIKLGLRNRIHSGESGLFNRACYGYRNNAEGELEIVPKEAVTVRLIFQLFLGGKGVVAISDELARRGVRSPTGKPRWSKRTLEMMLANIKYVGDSMVGVTFGDDYPSKKRYMNNGQKEKYLVTDNHAPIISREDFEKVQQLRGNLRKK
jgi:DNA invertase Pin-like site-specific DNA recombinase